MTMVPWARLTIGLGLVALPTRGDTQVRASERGSVAQTIDGTVIEVSYGRPRLRGRTAFGGVVHWGEMWTPGANWATTLTVTKNVRINDQPVPAGSYSVWVQPTEQAWTLFLNARAKRYHLERPKPDEMAVRLPIVPFPAPPVDLLTASFPETRRDGATLLFQWGPTAWSLRVDVERTELARRRLTAVEVAPYLGEYVAWLFGEAGDSTRWQLELHWEAEHLAGTINGTRLIELLPTGVARRFLFESRDEQGSYDVELDGPVVFAIGPGRRATGFTMKGIEQPYWLRAVRVDP